jgi:hypothetical protein
VTGVVIALSAYCVPLGLGFLVGRLRVVVVGAAIAVGWLLLAAVGEANAVDGREVVPLEIFATLVGGLLTIWCAGAATPWLVKRLTART